MDDRERKQFWDADTNPATAYELGRRDERVLTEREGSRMSWTLTKKFRFEAAHVLPHHDGKCSRLHGHSWRGAVICKGDILQSDGAKEGMLIDYADMSRLIDPLVSIHLDHFHLNDSLKMTSPTSELIAKWIFDQLKPHLPFLHAVEIEETCTSACRYEQGW